MANNKRWYGQLLDRLLHRDQTIPTKISLSFLLGFVTAVLSNATGTIGFHKITWVVITGLILFILVLLFYSPAKEMSFRQSRWSMFSVLLFGYAVGALLYFYRDKLKWVWQNVRRINDPLLTSMVLLGVILGFFVVRNWPKQQDDFIKSLAAIFGGTFIATLVGKVAESDSIRFLSHYAIGFTVSGVVNLLASSLLLAHYTNSKSRVSREIVAFLYGNDKTKEVDKSFQTNFEEDQDYARSLLTRTLRQYGERVKEEFAAKKERQRKILEQRRENLEKIRTKIDTIFGTQPLNLSGLTDDEKTALGEQIPDYEEMCEEATDIATRVKECKDDKVEYEETKKKTETGTDAEKKVAQANLAELKTPGVLDSEIVQLNARLRLIQETLNGTRNSYYYQLTSINAAASANSQQDSQATNNPDDQLYEVGFSVVDEIDTSMFRIGITVKWQDVLEYIVTPAKSEGSGRSDSPGQTKPPFPFRGSVAGLALTAQETIVMDRDMNKKFRAASFMDGKTPREVEQPRGLEEIDYLSYVSVPIISNFTNSEEGSLGVVNIDSKLFATSVPPHDMPGAKRKGAAWTMTCKREQLSEYSSNLYEQEDESVKYLDDMRDVIVPVLELYLRCRQGAST